MSTVLGGRTLGFLLSGNFIVRLHCDVEFALGSVMDRAVVFHNYPFLWSMGRVTSK